MARMFAYRHTAARTSAMIRRTLDGGGMARRQEDPRRVPREEIARKQMPSRATPRRPAAPPAIDEAKEREELCSFEDFEARWWPAREA
jgi:hypothetical protein